MTGTSTAVNDGESVSVQPNDYGRYYLTSTDMSGSLKQDVAEGLVISVRNGLVTVTAKDNISYVRAVNVSGSTAFETADCGTNVQFQLSQGSYVIEAESAGSKKTAKIFVR